MSSDDPSIQTASRARTELVAICEQCPERPYVELRIPDDFGEARQVHFVIDSRDQGMYCLLSHEINHVLKDVRLGF